MSELWMLLIFASSLWAVHGAKDIGQIVLQHSKTLAQRTNPVSEKCAIIFEPDKILKMPSTLADNAAGFIVVRNQDNQK